MPQEANKKIPDGLSKSQLVNLLHEKGYSIKEILTSGYALKESHVRSTIRDYGINPHKLEKAREAATTIGFDILAKNRTNEELKASQFINLIELYKERIRRTGNKDELYKWQLVQEFQGRPDPAAADFQAEVRSVKYANLVYGPGLGALSQLAKERTEPLRECFQNLFDPGLPLGKRLEDYSTRTLELFREVELDKRLSHHQDERSMATYLTYFDASSYTFYKNSFYKKLCKLLQIPAATKGKKYPHYLELVKDLVENHIREDQELLDLKRAFLPGDAYSDDQHLILAQDILYQTLDLSEQDEQRYYVGGSVWDEEDQLPRFLKDGIWENGYDGKNEQMVNSIAVGSKIAIKAVHTQEKVNSVMTIEARGTVIENEEDGHILKVEWEENFQPFTIGFSGGYWKTIHEVTEESHIDAIFKNTSSKETDSAKIKQMPKFSLNTILFGPPGTGKTYHTINKALEILGENTKLPRKELKEKFDQYVKDQRIAFTTFHQSLSYEDFIEGIKPVENDDPSLPIQYQTKAGIFKNICATAKGLQDIKAQPGNIFDGAKFFKMSLGGLQNPHIHDWCIKNSCVGLSWGGDKKYDAYRDIKVWKEFRDKFVNEFPDLVEKSRYNIVAMYTLRNMRIGDIVVITKGNHIIDAIGKITSEYYWDDNNDFEYYQFRKVEWLAADLNQDPSVFFNKKISQQAIYEFYEDDVKRETFKTLFKAETQVEEPQKKPYVLIIDEINRGNVSKIFGELITLLEEDKRLGRNEAVTLTLPYSRESFGVPSNLYIIGTMNTADRSVEALDTALRRRFCFEEMQPDTTLLSPAHTFWRFLWKYEKSAWDDADYLEKEEKVFQLLGISEELENERMNIWDEFEKEGCQEEQVSKLSQYVYSGINLQSLLTTINQRLEVLKDRDHQIGHAYLMKVYSIQELMEVFRDSIIPLLQEYFFADYYKIQLVLGEGFIRNTTAKVSFAIKEEEDYEDRRIYSINKEALKDPEKFSEALKSMNI